MDFAKVGPQAMTALLIGAGVACIAPIVIALIWVLVKKERFTTVLVGAAVFLIFALVLEKPIQNILLFPTQMGLPETSVSTYFNARPVLLAFMAGLFPGVFEETGRFVAYKTVLKNRKNRETSISYGIGHAGIEVIVVLGLTYITYIAYAGMINAGVFGTIVDQVAAQAPDQVGTVTALAKQLAAFTIGDVGLGLIERVFAVLYHIGASILVFYACKDTKKFWLYPLAILIHTALDFIAALSLFKVISLSAWLLEGIVGAFGILTFVAAYCLLYKKDKNE